MFELVHQQIERIKARIAEIDLLLTSTKRTRGVSKRDLRKERTKLVTELESHNVNLDEDDDDDDDDNDS